MPIHDWTQVDSGIFHALHLHWIAAIDGLLNEGLLPPGYYSLPEQVAGLGNPDVLAPQLTLPNTPSDPGANGVPDPSGVGGVAVATAPPRTRFTDRTDGTSIVRKTRSVVIRHVSGHRIVALIEIVSPSNKCSKSEIEGLVRKAVEFLRNGVHLMILDLFPPGPQDPQGLHPLIWSQFKATDFELPPDKPLTLAAYAAGPIRQAFVETVAIGDPLSELPLFLTPETYVPVPLEATYSAAWARIPRPWRDVVEPPKSADG